LTVRPGSVNNARDSSGFLTCGFTKIVRILVSPDLKAWSGYRGHPARSPRRWPGRQRPPWPALPVRWFTG